MSSIRVMLADDHPVVLAGMKALLDAVGDITVVGEATTGPGALEVFREADPDIAVLDISLPEINGLKLAEIAAIDFPKIKVLALTVHEDRAYVQPMMRAGARGYLLKRSAAEELVRAIRAIASGGLYLDPTIAEMVVPQPPDQATGRPQLAELSQRETEVLQMISRGLSNKEISGRLDVSVKTVETHKARALEKLGLRTRAEIVRYGVAHRWLDDLQ
ncbi:response regulator transcription factor [Bradyrhizobium icense]|uniref:DNA-binding response regulator n=1 Tax=Bradyrhizobium icense TaxID=1274631 RepID=A0A1B1UDR8_9BRAD|nr:response regulator transcription factor [Bradyrhizobium icense]ANW00920.1 DNA-binding response regulator [Bradyrhizobium icense]